jgi:hypothetical protein
MVVLVLSLASCQGRPASAGIYSWKTTLDWSEADTQRLNRAGVDRLGLRLFDWGVRGEEGPLAVRSPVPANVSVVPIVYVTVDRLEAWAHDKTLDPRAAAQTLFDAMKVVLARAWPGSPTTWQLDADWTARTRAAWFAVAREFGALVHARGGRFEVTVRLHQYRDRGDQGVPPADGGVLMLYGVGDAVLDAGVVRSYLHGPAYPLPLVPAFPTYTQVRQKNGYGRLVALYRLGSDAELPVGELESRGPDHYAVTRRTALQGGILLAHDELFVDRVSPAVLADVARLPEVSAMRGAAGDRVWVFDYDPNGWEDLVHGPLAEHLFPR